MDDIFDLDSVDLESLSPTEEGVEAVPVEDGEAYWQFSTDALASFLALAQQFSWRSGRDLTSKSVSLSTSDDRTKLVCRATDFDTFLEVRIPLTTPNPITTPLVFPTATLSKLPPLSPKTIVLKKDAVLIMGQWVPIETTILDPLTFIQQDSIQALGTITLPKALNSIASIAASASVPQDRLIRFYPTKVVSTVLWTSISAEAQSPCSFSLTAKEAQTILKLQNPEGIKLSITQSDLPRLVFQSPTTTLWILQREAEQMDLSPTPQLPPVEVDLPTINRVCSISETMPGSSGLVEWSADSQKLTLTYLSRLSQVPYTVPTVGEVSHLSPSRTQTKILKDYLKPLASKPPRLLASWDQTSLYLQGGEVLVTIRWEQ